MPKAITKVFLSLNLNKSKKCLYQPVSIISGFEAAEIKGITTETPTVSIMDRKTEKKNRTTR
jgi:hypothetical protein